MHKSESVDYESDDKELRISRARAFPRIIGSSMTSALRRGFPRDTHELSGMKTGVTPGLWLFATAFIAIIVTTVAFRFSASSLWDDAFMFVRYADNILTSGTVSFNPGGEATYGLTSLAFLGVVLPIWMIFPDSPVLTMIIASAVCGFLFVGILIVLLKKYVASKSAQLRNVAIVLILFSLAYAIGNFSTHFVSGMDTMFALAFVTVYILISKWHEHSLSQLSMWLTGCMGGLAFAVRPDIMIYTAILPVTSLLFSSSRKARVMAMGILMVTGIVALLQILIYAQYLNSPLPLPFYAKGLKLYGNAIQEQYRLTPWRELHNYVFSFPLLFSVIGIAFILDPRDWWKKLSSTDKGLLVSTIIFSGYYLFFVLQVMYYSQRFYYPTLPALAFLAAQSFVFIVEKPLLSSVLHRDAIRRLLRAVLIMAAIFYMLKNVDSVSEKTVVLLKGRALERYHFDIKKDYRERYSHFWFCLDQVSSLPDDLSIATSEVGHPLAMNPKKVIIDLTGLNETMIAHNGFSADRFFQHYQPDLIYMPHPHYQDIIQQISHNPYFLSHYEYFSSSVLSATVGIAIKRDSKYYVRLREIVESATDAT